MSTGFTEEEMMRRALAARKHAEMLEATRPKDWKPHRCLPPSRREIHEMYELVKSLPNPEKEADTADMIEAIRKWDEEWIAPPSNLTVPAKRHSFCVTGLRLLATVHVYTLAEPYNMSIIKNCPTDGEPEFSVEEKLDSVPPSDTEEVRLPKNYVNNCYNILREMKKSQDDRSLKDRLNRFSKDVLLD